MTSTGLTIFGGPAVLGGAQLGGPKTARYHDFIVEG